MRVAVTCTIVFEVSDAPVADVKADFLRAHEMAIGQRYTTLTGRPYVLRAIERFEVVERTN